ncbi:unnamed protein product [Pleuronectes platessa]|uniref:Uncharacterized protein n=1 Tax=Pleuronectes platessa TaxID=8262 RepID=A0A9N7V6Z3_PLEPL|nr:unnamed protein product [Pleuronectes platessa]
MGAGDRVLSEEYFELLLFFSLLFSSPLVFFPSSNLKFSLCISYKRDGLCENIYKHPSHRRTSLTVRASDRDYKPLKTGAMEEEVFAFLGKLHKHIRTLFAGKQHRKDM